MLRNLVTFSRVCVIGGGYWSRCMDSIGWDRLQLPYRSIGSSLAAAGVF